jgi:transposase
VLDLEGLSRDELIALVRYLTAQLSDQAAQLTDQTTQLADQAVELERLQAELERIKRLISRNSGNSSMPPSSDDLPGRSRPADKPKKKEKKEEEEEGKAERTRGKQRGAAGSHLPWMDESDVDVIHQLPRGQCECGADLADAADLGVEKAYQVTDVPLVTPVTKEIRSHQVVCACGKVHVAAAPAGAGVANTRVYGENLRALIVYLLIVQHLPVQRCVRLVSDLLGTQVSDGFAHSMLAHAAKAVTDTVKMIKMLIVWSYVVHFDETTLRVGKAKAKKYVWAACTELYSLFTLGSRSGKKFRKWGVGPALRGVVVHDRYAVYDEKDNFTGQVKHQLCCAHLLRDLTDAAEIYPKAHWPKQCHKALQSLIHEANLASDAGKSQIDPTRREELIKQFRQGVLVGLKEVPRVGGPRDKQPPARALLECLQRRHDDVIRFCYDTRIPPTNNLAERDLRPQKIQQNVSGRLTSEDATSNRLTIRSYLSTALKHGFDAMTAIRNAIAGDPWTPPAAQAITGQMSAPGRRVPRQAATSACLAGTGLPP